MYIFDAIYTPRGAARKGGALSGVAPADLLAGTIDSMLARAPDAAPAGVFAGCVTQSGEQGGHIARTAALLSGLPEHTAALTLNNFCCSGLDAIWTAALQGSAQNSLQLAGGVESMSRVAPFSDGGPYYSDPKMMQRTGFVPLWFAADFVATLQGISREEADAYAARSQARAQARTPASVIPVETPHGRVTSNETPRVGVTAESLAGMEPMAEKLGPMIADQAFLAAYPDAAPVNHIHTFGNAPALADAASMLLVGDLAAGEAAGLRPKARIVSYATVADDKLLSLTGGLKAAREVLDRAGMSASDIDLFEFNEAYAAVCIQFMRHLDIDPDRMNTGGGAIALGHPMGATGGILLATLLECLEREDRTTGMAAISGASGLGSAMIIERLS
ncbi:acetyl-CoA C-acyltransferase [Kordiimonas lacus]|uniref:Acetyl-CoA C-acetyltransferase n=1 Tax=Kordiimonas lacus TaxID=637679 RepID=A0A1G6YNI7_9PROT|nr:acetyl-CoA C-acyltransferase [Kordiimonas lacus]SDD91949.1 acetyl-CoA C-acetyltransferase [Kordiimonas lacus]